MPTTLLAPPRLGPEDVGLLLAQHPWEAWASGLAAGALLGWAALWVLRGLRWSAPPLQRHVPARARWLMLVAMAAAAGALVLAAEVLAELAESGTEGGWGLLDDALAAGLRTQADPHLLRWFAVLTHLGDTAVLTALAAAVAAALWWRGHRLLALGWLVALAGNGALTRILKQVFERVRPEHVHGLAEAHGYSFPSGHSSASMVAYSMLAYLATRLLAPPWHLPAALLASALIVTTGCSRIVLQVHYASDVLAGWVLGATWTVCAVLILEGASRWHAGRGEAKELV